MKSPQSGRLHHTIVAGTRGLQTPATPSIAMSPIFDQLPAPGLDAQSTSTNFGGTDLESIAYKSARRRDISRLLRASGSTRRSVAAGYPPLVRSSGSAFTMRTVSTLTVMTRISNSRM